MIPMPPKSPMSPTETLLRQATPQYWRNPQRRDALPPPGDPAIAAPAIAAARARLQRFAPALALLFPELAASQGAISSALLPAPAMQAALGLESAPTRLWIKADHSLPVAGSIKARGGFHEVLENVERVAQANGLLAPSGDTRTLTSAAARAVFARHRVSVGSTGNLGLAIGVMAAAWGFQAEVHMSEDAKGWKKERLRQRGVQVVEHAGDYAQAVARGRALAQADARCHFVDDEHSSALFLGYAVAAQELQTQLQQQGVVVDAAHPLSVILPCGVGGAPGGIAWGLQQLFGADVRCTFVEPVQSPCFLAQMLAPPGTQPTVYDFGLTNRTEADGLAVPGASLLAAQAMRTVLAGICTVTDTSLLQHLQTLHASEGLCVEPSAAAGFEALRWLWAEAAPGTTHVVWTTGGSLVPAPEFQRWLQPPAHA